MTGGFAVRGVIEGFYGRPWTQAQRLEMVGFLAARGMNTFVYAPKDDPLLRRDWRRPFGEHEHHDLAELRQACTEAGLRLLVCVSPGLTIRYADPGDVAVLGDSCCPRCASVPTGSGCCSTTSPTGSSTRRTSRRSRAWPPPTPLW